MKRILISCDSLKGTLSSPSFGDAIASGYQKGAQRGASSVRLEFSHSPMSDGGSGLIDSLTHREEIMRGTHGIKKMNDFPYRAGKQLNLQRVAIPWNKAIRGPLDAPIGEKNQVCFACDVEKRVIVVEMAGAAGLPLIPAASRSPWETSSYGVGEVILFALQYMSSHLSKGETKGNREGVTLLLGIGGSATNEGGLGALQSLGLDVYVETTSDATAASLGSVVRLAEPFKGKHLIQLHHVEVTDSLRELFSRDGHLAAPSAASPCGCFIERMHLICDVENPLVGPSGATYVFGPQKCSPVLSGVRGGGDAEVGVVTSAAQQKMLDDLERGMRQAARRVVSSTWKHRPLLHHDHQDGQENLEVLCRDLLHSERGGGAGGMSGFFRYLLGSTCLPGAIVMAGLQSLRLVEDMPWEATTPAPPQPRGLLYEDWSTLVTGEGSFDKQSIASRKTVGMLLEMVVECCAYYLKVNGGSGALQEMRGTEKKVVIVCGRCSFSSAEEALAELKTMILRKLDESAKSNHPSFLLQWCLELAARNGTNVKGVVDGLVPQLVILPLTSVFSLEESMSNPYECVERIVEQFVCKDEGMNQGVRSRL